MAITVIQTSPTARVTAAGTITATLGSPTGARNTLVACITANGTTANPVATAVTLGGAADNWAQVVANNPAVQSDAQIWYDPGCAGGQTSIVVTFGTAGSGTIDEELTVYEVAGVLVADKTVTVNSAAATTFSSGATAAVTKSDEIFFGALISASSTLPVATGAGTWTTQGSSAGPHWQLAGFQIVSGGGTATYSGTQASGTYSVAVATFFPPPVSYPLPPLPPETFAPLSWAFGPNPPFFVPGPQPPPAGAPQTGPPVYPLGHPVQARQLPQRGGWTASRRGVFAQLGPPVTPPRGPVKAQPAVPYLKGRAASRGGAFGGTGPPVTPPRGPVAAKGRGLPPRGRTVSRTGTFAQLGPPVTPPRGPVKAQAPLTRSLGRAQSRAGTFTAAAAQPGPPVYPLGHPVRARPQPPPRGRIVKTAGPYAGTGPPVKPLQQPVSAARRPLPPRGRTAALPGPYAGTGPPAVPLRHPVRGQPQKPVLTGRAAWRTGPGVPPPALVNATSTPAVGDPDTSAATVTDPRDGTRAVTAAGTSVAGVTDPRDGTPGVSDPATSAPRVSDG